MAHRVFGPRPAKRKPVSEKTADHDVSPIAERIATDLGQDAETAQRVIVLFSTVRRGQVAAQGGAEVA